MSSKKTDRLGAAFGWILGAMSTFLGLVFVTLGGYELWQGSRTKSWPAAPGKIVESAIESVRTRSGSSRRAGDTDYRVRVRYVYEVAGQEFEGRRLQYGYESHDKRSAARKEQSRYTPGREVQVYYDPESPDTSVLVRGSGTSWLAVGLGTTALVFGLVTLVSMIRKRRAAASPTG